MSDSNAIVPQAPAQPPRVHAHPVLPPELAPRDVGPKGGVQHVAHLRPDVARAWPFLARALASVGASSSLVSAIASRLWELASVMRPSAVVAREHGRRDIAEERLAPHLQRGLPLKLACARAAVREDTVRRWMREDPTFEARLEAYRLTGVGRIHGLVIERAEAGSETAATKLLEWSGEPEYTPKLRVGRITEDDVVQSDAFQRFLRVQLPALLCQECRDRVKEAGGG